MDFLGIGVPELAVIFILMLIFIGPRDMPKAMRRLGKFVRDLQEISTTFSSTLQREMNELAEDEAVKTTRQEFIEAKNSLAGLSTEIKSIGSGPGRELKDTAPKLPPPAANAPETPLEPPAAPVYPEGTTRSD